MTEAAVVLEEGIVVISLFQGGSANRGSSSLTDYGLSFQTQSYRQRPRCVRACVRLPQSHHVSSFNTPSFSFESHMLIKKISISTDCLVCVCVLAGGVCVAVTGLDINVN